MNAINQPQQVIVAKSGCGKAALIIASIFGVGVLCVGGCALVGMAGCGRAITTALNESAKKTEARRNAAAHLQLIDFQWRKAQFGSAIEADFGVRNTGRVPLKDFEITCVGLAPSGTKVDSRTCTILERIEPGQTRHFKSVNFSFLSPEATQAKATITGALAVD